MVPVLVPKVLEPPYAVPVSVINLLPIKPNQNLIIQLNPFLYDHYMLHVIALTQIESVPMSLLSQVYTTASYDKNKERIYFEIFNHKTSISKARFGYLLGLANDASVISPDFITTTQLFSMFYDMGYTNVLTTVTKFKKSCLPLQWNGLLTLINKGLAERVAGSDGTSKGLMTILYGLYHVINLDYGSLIWSQLVQSINSITRHSKISCGRFWTIVTRQAIEHFQIPVMTDALLSCVATFHTKKIIFSNATKFSFNGSIPETMYRCVTSESKVMAEYRKLPPTGPRQLTPEMREALDVVEKPAK